MAAWLIGAKLNLIKRGRKATVWTTDNVMKVFHSTTALNKSFEYLLATGNLNSKTGLVGKVKK